MLQKHRIRRKQTNKRRKYLLGRKKCFSLISSVIMSGVFLPCWFAACSWWWWWWWCWWCWSLLLLNRCFNATMQYVMKLPLHLLWSHVHFIFNSFLNWMYQQKKNGVMSKTQGQQKKDFCCSIPNSNNIDEKKVPVNSDSFSGTLFFIVK